MGILERALNLGESKKFKAYERRVERINSFEGELELESDEELRERFAELREEVAEGRDLEDVLPEAFAITREASRRTLGMRHFDVQLIGGAVLFIVVMVYALVAMVLGDITVRHSPWYVQLPFFAVLGLIWIIPAGLIIRFMQAPDRP